MVENNFSIDADIKVSMVCLADSEYRVCLADSEYRVCLADSEYRVCLADSEYRVCLADSGSITRGSTKKSIKEIKLKKQPSKKSMTLNIK